MPESDYVEFSIRDNIAEIFLNRPAVHNAFDSILISSLLTVLKKLKTDFSIRALVLRGKGKHFSAGADIEWMRACAGYSEAENQREAMKLAELMNFLYEFDRPTIAMVHGAAFGGALGLIASCDIAISTEDARFCLSEVKLGIIPAVISPYLISVMGERQANRFALTAEIFSAKTALSLGLIHEIHSSDTIEDRTREMTQRISENGPRAIIENKLFFREIAGKLINQSTIQKTAEKIANLRCSEEAQEGLSAFLEKRAPNWIKKS